jgi:L-asparaginase
VAANYPINEVSLFFNNRLYRGNRTTKAHADGFDAFASPNLQPLLEAGIHIRRLGTPPANTAGELIVHPIPAADWRGDHLSGYFCGRGA